MSAIGSYEVLNRERFEACVNLARDIRAVTTGKWLFKSTTTVGREEFDAAWRAAVLETVPFEYSGYALGNYVDAQLAVNDTQLFDEESELALVLGKVFTAAFVFDTPRPLPAMSDERR